VRDVIGKAALFPLPNGTLLPGELLPLRIFEPRYRRMMESVRRTGDLIAIGTLLPGWEADYAGEPPVADVVGVGRVVKDRLETDGTSMVVLQGVARGRILSEIGGKVFREVRFLLQRPEWLHPAEAFRLRRMLLTALARRVEPGALSLDVTAEFDVGALVDKILSALKLQSEQRVAVQQALDVERRTALLLELTEDPTHRERLAAIVPVLGTSSPTFGGPTDSP